VLNLAERLKVTRPVKLMESALVQIPTVVGWFRPVILLPASALTGLSPEQIEALLAHELAHIRRYDYLVNMFQTLVEILGFYHPAVWWISYTIRVERENCCDDLAVSVCGDKVGYARALTSMEEARFAKGELAVAASGGSLSRRIRRLIGKDSAVNKRLGYVPVVISVLLIMALMIPTTLAITAKRENRDSGPNSTTESDSIKAVDAYIAATDKMNDYDPKYPATNSGNTAKKAQILFDCEIYEVPADLKFIEDEQRKGISGPIMKLLESLKSEREKGSAGISIQLGKEYADSLKALSRENEYVKVLAAPKLMTLDGKEATVNTTQNVSYTADYETDKGDDKPKPIIKNLPCEMELKVKGEVAKNNTIFTHLRLTLSKPVFATKQNDDGREIQIPIIERSDCTTYVGTRSGESIILGGLRSDEGSSRNLILVITPSIIRPEKGPEQTKIVKEIRAVAYDPEHIVVFPETEKRNVIAETRRPEQDKVMLEQQARDLEQKAAELHQLQKDIQKQIEDLERKKSELLSYNRITTSLREAKSEHERLAVMAAIFAERGDFAKAIEHLEKAIELAKDKKDYGIGIAIEKVDGLIRISQLLPDAPASGSSFRQGDIIMAIDGVSTEGMSLNEVVAAIRGPKGTKVNLTVKSHSRDIIVEETFTRQLLLKGSPALQEYYRRLDAYEAGKTWPQYRDMMKDYKPWPGGAVHIYELKYANPEELAELLNRILQRRWKGIKDKPKDSVTIVPDPGHKKLIILASPADIRLIEALIAELDVLAKRDTVVLKAPPGTEYKQESAAGSTITKVIKLKYADSASLAQILMKIVSDTQLKVVANERTNMLIVAGTESAIQQIMYLVAELDVPSRKDSTDTKTGPSSKPTPDTSAEHVFYEIIQLKYSDCERMSEKAVKILSADQQFQLVPLKDANQLIIFGSNSAIKKIKALVAELDVPDSDTDREVLDTNKQEKVDSDLTPSPPVK
jgi:type II secretory pathway component GspD/PulD (secretin)